MQLTKGLRYRVKYRYLRSVYEMVAEYMDFDRGRHIDIYWSLRPLAGTQKVDLSQVISATETTDPCALPKRVRTP
jgi:hypothetical protein